MIPSKQFEHSLAVLNRTILADMMLMAVLRTALLTQVLLITTVSASLAYTQENATPPLSEAERPTVDINSGVLGTSSPDLSRGSSSIENAPLIPLGTATAVPSVHSNPASSTVSASMQADVRNTPKIKSTKKRGVISKSAELGKSIGSISGAVIGTASGGAVGVGIKLGWIGAQRAAGFLVESAIRGYLPAF